MAASYQDIVAEGYDAVARGDIERARLVFEQVLTRRQAGAPLEGLARARYLAFEYPGSIESYERAFVAYKREGNALGAARVARMLCWIHLNVSGDWALAYGWLARGRSMLMEAGEGTVEHGWADLFGAIAASDRSEREQGFRAAISVGRQYRDGELEMEALGWLGSELVATDRIAEGMALLDEALTGIVAGEVDDPYVHEGGFCRMLFACELIQDVDRAEQWLRAGDEIARRRNMAAIGAHCRSYAGGIFTIAGRWSEAEEALLEATRFFDRGMPAGRIKGLVRLADLRIRQGRLEEAGQLLQGLEGYEEGSSSSTRR
jgi:hypothetical protein